jgi:O-antigen/teichoic acid export membrane protein
MTHTLKKKTTSALVWNGIDKGGFQVVALLVGIITARLLSPKDFGLIGALAVFTMLSNILVESGFSAALIRRKNNTSAEYTAMLYFHVALSVLIYWVLFFSAPLIAAYFRMPELLSLSRVLFLAIIFNSFGIVQNIVLSKELAFRPMMFANMTAAVVSGIVTVAMVLYGFEYWALVWQQLLQVGVKALLLWVFSSWRPIRQTDFRVIKEVFSFSVFLLFTSFVNAVVKNIYNLIIGRMYTVQDLGYYTQANKFQQIPSQVITQTQSGVAYPVLSHLNEEPERQRNYLRKIIRITAFLVFPVMIGLFALAEELVTIVLTDKWLPAVPYFRILIVAAIVAPFHTLNLNALTVRGFSRINFRLEMLRNGLIILSLFITSGSINQMLIGFSMANLLSLLVDLIVVQVKLRYSLWDQLKDIAPYAVVSLGILLIVYFGNMLQLNIYLLTSIQIIVSGLFYFISLKLLGSKIFEEVISIFKK